MRRGEILLGALLAGLWAGRTVAVAATPAAAAPGAALAACTSWPEWDRFRGEFLSTAGRIEDHDTARRQTVSEGQAYALFFALVADDRTTFDQVLGWTENNLAAGDLTAHLPAWLWGQDDQGAWRVLDTNPASDADLWMAYTLLEAGRIWQERRLVALGRLMARQILAQETRDLSGLGRVLLPATTGFESAQGLRLNPSYSPLPVLRRLASSDVEHAASWQALTHSAALVISGAAPHGLVADWVGYQPGYGFRPDEASHAQGSYDAIRVYLWLGLSPASDTEAQSLAHALQPMARLSLPESRPPERIEATRGLVLSAPGPPGFLAALAPFIERVQPAAAANFWQRAAAQPPARGAYFNQALAVFALGWHEHHFRFADDGALLRDTPVCASAP